MSDFGLDALLGEDDDPPPTTNRRRFVWLRYGLTAAAFTAVTVVGMRMFNIELSVWAIFAGFLALLAVRRVTTQVAPPPAPRRHRYRDTADDAGRYRSDERDALRGAVKSWEKALGRAGGDRDWFRQELLPMLGELADERLRQRHGLTRASDPDRARALLGEPLWNLLAGKGRRSPSPKDYTVIVAELENL
ncbi:hypothetical protein GCM10027290_08890 [Micromonospora sonneratiae]|uniref:DUF4129 domain-containing protein n=1 Tax=Micromonospora sonneratiae TaxID=1184706 RepID=A0ABW3YF31_9ACTN